MYNSDGDTPSRGVGRKIDYLYDQRRAARGDGSHTRACQRQVGRSESHAQRDVAAEVHNQRGVGTMLSARWPAEHLQSRKSWDALTQAKPWERGAVRVSASGEEDANVARAIAASHGHKSSRKDDVRNVRLKEIESQFRQLRLSQRQLPRH